MNTISFSFHQWTKNRTNILTLIILVPLLLVVFATLSKWVSNSLRITRILDAVSISSVITSNKDSLTGEFNIPVQSLKDYLSQTETKPHLYIPLQIGYIKTYLKSTTKSSTTPFSLAQLFFNVSGYSQPTNQTLSANDTYLLAFGVETTDLDRTYRLFDGSNLSVAVISEVPIPKTELQNNSNEILIGEELYTLDPHYPQPKNFDAYTIVITPINITKTLFETSNLSHIFISGNEYLFDTFKPDNTVHILKDEYITHIRYLNLIYDSFFIFIIILLAVFFGMMGAVIGMYQHVYMKQNKKLLTFLVRNNAPKTFPYVSSYLQLFFLSITTIGVTYILFAIGASLNLFNLVPSQLAYPHINLVGMGVLIAIPMHGVYLFAIRSLRKE